MSKAKNNPIETEVPPPVPAEIAGKEVTTTDIPDMADDFGNEDCARGRISIMQATSDKVKTDEARQGAFINLADCTELAYKEEKPLEFVFVSFIKYWHEVDAKTQETVAIYPGKHDKEHDWEYESGGRKIKRLFTYLYVILLASDLEKGIVAPYEIALRSTGLATAKKMNAKLREMRRSGFSSWDKTFKLTCKLVSKNNNSWYGVDYSVGRDTAPAEKELVKKVREEFVLTQEDIMKAQADNKPDITVSADQEY